MMNVKNHGFTLLLHLFEGYDRNEYCPVSV
ncbi:MAG: hypothetical protein RLZZ45_1247 [Bacteroidota bacterium]|jgi:hypothetical protein